MTKIFYKEISHEKAVLEAAISQKIPVLLKGPTGCGKSRFVESIAQEKDLQLITVACNDETSATDLIGRYLIIGSDTVWQDGPVTKAVKEGGILYLDEIAEAREDVITVLHSLSDHRRELYIDRKNESIKAHEDFHMIVSFNPGYQQSLKEMKPSTRQRFVSIAFDYPEEKIECEIIQMESDLNEKDCRKLVALGKKIRNLNELGLAETVSTRLLVSAAKMIKAGLAPRLACEVCIIQSLSDDNDVIDTLKDIVSLVI